MYNELIDLFSRLIWVIFILFILWIIYLYYNSIDQRLENDPSYISEIDSSDICLITNDIDNHKKTLNELEERSKLNKDRTNKSNKNGGLKDPKQSRINKNVTNTINTGDKPAISIDNVCNVINNTNLGDKQINTNYIPPVGQKIIPDDQDIIEIELPPINKPIYNKNGDLPKSHVRPTVKSFRNKKMDGNGKETPGEIICRQVLEKFYQQPFPRARPDFLKNPETGYNLELDGYNENLGIAFEYNGIQHYTYPNRYNKNETEFIQQLRRDQFKKEVCDKMGIYLIIIPYHVAHNQIENYIFERLPSN